VPEADLKLLQGTLDVLILKALTFGPQHGFAVAQWIRQTSDDALKIEDGALYTSLHRMAKRGWITSAWGLSENNRRAKYYRLTTDGRRQLKADAAKWTRYAEALFKILRATAPGAVA
jgi:PadR family transcriptional regulator PadR